MYRLEMYKERYCEIKVIKKVHLVMHARIELSRVVL